MLKSEPGKDFLHWQCNVFYNNCAQRVNDIEIKLILAVYISTLL